MVTEEKIDSTPVRWSSVRLSDVKRLDGRLDAALYDSDAENYRKAVENGKFPATTITGDGGLATAYMLNRFKRILAKTNDYPIYQPSSICDIYPKPYASLSTNSNASIEQLRVHKGQLLLTRSGTIGKIAYVSDTLDNCILSDDLIRIDCKDPEDSGYVYAYLKSDVGHTILLTTEYGSVISHIEPDHLNAVMIPDAPANTKKKINDAVKRSYELRDRANTIFDAARRMLQEELCLPNIDDIEKKAKSFSDKVNAYSVQLSQLDGRLDGSYHLPVVNDIEELIRNNAAEVTTVGDKRVSKEIALPPRYKRIYVDKDHGIPFVGGKQILELDPSDKKYLSRSDSNMKVVRKLEVSEGTVLITRSGTIGRVALVGKRWDKWTVSDHLVRITPVSRDIAGYLYTYLSSDYGTTLIKRYTYGSVIDEVDEYEIGSIIFPILKDSAVQKHINDMALEANRMLDEAFDLEHKAIQMVNDDVIYVK